MAELRYYVYILNLFLMGRFDPAKLVVEGWNGYVREKRKSENLLALRVMIIEVLRSMINSLIIHLEKLGMNRKYVIKKVTV
ncbi:MAG TPA: hypothetical protein VK553_09845 [Candidatus Nitrosopolaris rasttigaisensis]|nr:hypothetical protein [Candidatus Nitrosopolaris rasttigaisensis]